MSNEEKISPRESLRMKMLAAGPHQMVEVTAEELSYILRNDINELIREVELIREGNRVHEATERGLAAMAGGETHADHLQQVQDQTAGVELVSGSEMTVDSGTFEDAVKPLMRYLALHHCPHSHIVVTAVGAELFHGQKSFNSFEFVKD